jgi:C2 domain-containing protein 3
MSAQNLNPLNIPLNIDCGNGNDSDSPSSLLSRALKRKFTELDEITQRLKARLFDVTGDENFDPDEEFERDLNTEVDKMDDVEYNPTEFDNFGWLRKSANESEGMMNGETKGPGNIEPVPSTSAGSRSALEDLQREISGCSNPVPKNPGNPLTLENILNKYDIDTIINPSIFRNILDPSIGNSDSTPPLNTNPFLNPNPNTQVAERDDATTISSIMSQDHMQSIQFAMQKTSIDDNVKSEESFATRPMPEGEQNSSNE